VKYGAEDPVIIKPIIPVENLRFGSKTDNTCTRNLKFDEKGREKPIILPN